MQVAANERLTVRVKFKSNRRAVKKINRLLRKSRKTSRAKVVARVRASAAEGAIGKAKQRIGLKALAPLDQRDDALGNQLELPALVAERPEVDPLASGRGVAREQLRTVLRAADADLIAQLVGVAIQ